MVTYEEGSLEQELVSLSVACSNNLYAREPGVDGPLAEEAISRLSPGFRISMGLDYSRKRLNWEEARQSIKTFLDDTPEACIHVNSTRPRIDLEKGTADVCLKLELKSAIKNAHKWSFGIWSWKQDVEGRWICHECWDLENLIGMEPGLES